MSVEHTNFMSALAESASSASIQAISNSQILSVNNVQVMTPPNVNNSEIHGIVDNENQHSGNKEPKKKNAIKKEKFRQTMQGSGQVFTPRRPQGTPILPQQVCQNVPAQNFQRNDVAYPNCQQPYRQGLPLLHMVNTVQMHPTVQIHNAGGNVSPMNIPIQSPGSPQYLNNLMQHPLLGFRNMMQTSPNLQMNTNNAFLQNAYVMQHQINAATPKPSVKFEPYISPAEVEEGLKTNRLFMGSFRTNAKNIYNSYVTINNTEQDILIEGFNNRNRALDGDIVIIQLIDDAEIKANKQSMNKARKEKRDMPQAKNSTSDSPKKKEKSAKQSHKTKNQLKKELQVKNETALRSQQESIVEKQAENLHGKLKTADIKYKDVKEHLENKYQLKEITKTEILCSTKQNSDDTNQTKEVQTPIDCNNSEIMGEKRLKDKKGNNDNELVTNFRKQLKVTHHPDININQNSLIKQENDRALDIQITKPKSNKNGNEKDEIISKDNSEIMNISNPMPRKCEEYNNKKKTILNKDQDNENKNKKHIQKTKDLKDVSKEKQQHCENFDTNPKQSAIEYQGQNLKETNDNTIENNGSTEENMDRKLKQGKVVYIQESVHSRITVGFLKLMPDKNKSMAILQPRDPKVPLISIPCTFWPDNFYKKNEEYANTLFLAKILEWTDIRYATGTIISMIGISGDLETEQKAILAQNDLDVTPFDPALKIFYPPLDYQIPPQEIKLREDCRKLCIFAIDPYNCRDIDDTVSCRELDNGNYEIGVHISDVSYYLMENTPLDQIVAWKATTIYMVERAFHMLPDDLCLLCSLFPGKDKLAFSVFWEITKDAEILSHRFSKTVIQSCAQLSYEHAQDILDGKNIENDFPTTYNGYKYNDICKTINILGSIARILRQHRFDGGALKVDQLKVNIKLDSSGLPMSYSVYEGKESNYLIEEFMLLANCTVAKRIYNDYPEFAFLRCHEPPNPKMMRDLDQTFQDLGWDVDVSTAGSLNQSLLMCFEGKDAATIDVISKLCAKPMARAKYFCAAAPPSTFEHYALNVPLYTHFTSPIRRYPDIMVHRLLSASLKFRDSPNWNVEKLKTIACRCNKNKQNAKMASDMSREVYVMKYLNMHSPLVMDAIVCDIKSSLIEVVIPEIALTKWVNFRSDFPGSYKYIKNDKNFRLSKMEITWNKTKKSPQLLQTLEILSPLRIEMVKADDLIKVDFFIVRPE